MPERLIDLLFRFLSQNDGRLSQRARAEEFSALTDQEARRVGGNLCQRIYSRRASARRQGDHHDTRCDLPATRQSRAQQSKLS